MRGRNAGNNFSRGDGQALKKVDQEQHEVYGACQWHNLDRADVGVVGRFGVGTDCFGGGV